MRIGVDVAVEGKILHSKTFRPTPESGGTIATVVMTTEHGRKVRVIGTTRELRMWARGILKELARPKKGIYEKDNQRPGVGD